MILPQNYISRYFQKMTTNKGQNPPTTLLTPLNYSGMYTNEARTENLDVEHPNQCQNGQIIRSLLLDFNSLFLEKISLLSHLEFPVNFEAHIPKKKESPLKTVRFVHMDVN